MSIWWYGIRVKQTLKHTRHVSYHWLAPNGDPAGPGWGKRETDDPYITDNLLKARMKVDGLYRGIDDGKGYGFDWEHEAVVVPSSGKVEDVVPVLDEIVEDKAAVASVVLDDYVATVNRAAVHFAEALGHEFGSRWDNERTNI